MLAIILIYFTTIQKYLQQLHSHIQIKKSKLPQQSYSQYSLKTPYKLLNRPFQNNFHSNLYYLPPL